MPVSTRRLLDVSVAALTSLGALLLGLARYDVVLPVCALVAAALSLWLTDATGRFQLRRIEINAALVGAVVFTVWRFARSTGVLGFLVFVDLFVLIHVVLLFEKKSLRTRWDLVMLSWTQVGVAAVLSQGALFGALLPVYAFLAFAVAGLLHLDREFATALDDGGGAAGARAVLPERRRLGKVALATLLVGPASLFLRFREVEDERPARPGGGVARPGRPLGRPADSARSAAGRAGPSRVGWEFWGRVALVFAVAMGLTMLAFPVIPRIRGIELRFPRFGRVSWGDDRSRRTVGFHDRVVLGELGELRDSRETVMRVRFLDHATGSLYPLRGEVYLRGAVLTEYDNGQWSNEAVGRRFRRIPVARLDRADGVVRQEIAVAPMDRDELFCVWPFLATKEDARLWMEIRHERLHRQADLIEIPLNFELATTAFVDGIQSEIAPDAMPRDVERLRRLPRDRLPKLVTLADSWIARSGLPPDDVLHRAKSLEAALRDGGEFRYSMEGVPRAARVDPVEDFVTSNPRGNCEYFATALTLMLRSQGIPARMVVGFKCGEYDYAGNFYQVRQLHAHSWVEAYLAPNQLPADLPHGDRFSDWSHGGWLRLDPTPAATGYRAAVGNLVDGVGNWLERLRYVWLNYVVGMDGAKQREAIYGPALEMARGVVRRVRSLAWWQSVPGRFARVCGLGGEPGLEGRRVAVRAGLAVTLMLLVALVGLRRLGLRVGRRLRVGSDPTCNGRAAVSFYHRFEAALARHGLVRAPTQTPREFARAAGPTVARASGSPSLGALPVRVVEAFYRVRFGRFRIEEPERRALADALSELERAGEAARVAENSPEASRG